MNSLTKFIRYALIANILALWMAYGFAATPTSTSLAITPNPVQAGQTLTATVTVTGDHPTKVVCVTYDGADFDQSCAGLFNGQATIAMSAGATAVLGDHSMVASYYGNRSNESSTSASVGYTVIGVMLQGNSNAITVGQSVTLTATVGGSNPGGTVTFKDGVNDIGTFAVTQAQAVFSYTVNTAGLHQITAEYSGDSNYPPVTSGAFAISAGAPTTTTLSVSPNPVNVEQALTATVTVSGNDPTGTVCVRYDDGNLGEKCRDLTSGQATIVGPFAATSELGSHTATVTYQGDSANASSTSAHVSYDVFGVTLQSDLWAPQIGQATTFTATVAGNDPGGTVRFMDGVNQIGAVALSQGHAVLTYAFTTVGFHDVTAEYSGDSNNSPATSASSGVSVVGPTTTTLSLSPNPVIIAAEMTATVTVSGDNPGGRVCVKYDGGASGQRCEYLYDGQATVTSPWYATTELGGHTAVAAYLGDYVNAASTSATVGYTVVEEHTNTPPSVSLTSPANNATFVAPANLVLTAFASDLDGTIAKVEFFSGQSLLATATQAPYEYNWTNVTAGTYQLTATATDNLGSIASSTAVNLTVTANQAPTVSITATPSNTTAPATIALDATAADADGSIAKVEFFNGGILLGTTTLAPYSYSWPNVAQGSYTVIARATDNGGATAESTPIVVTVSAAEPSPPAPVPGQAYYIQSDHLNTPRVITDKDNNVVWQWDNSEPFGTSVPNGDPGNTGSQFIFNPRFPGQYFDKETNLHYNYFRDYDPATGRYIQSDPIGLEGGINTYSYVGGDPISYTDPLGLVEIYRDGGVTISSYPGPQAGGIEHARAGAGENYHIHMKDSAGREARISTETWKPLTPDDQRIYDRSKAMQNTCEKLSDADKKFYDRINREIFHRGRPTVSQVTRLGQIRGGIRGGTMRGSD